MRELLRKALRVAFADQDHALAGVLARPPQPVILVAGDCRRQAVPGAEQIDSGSLAIVVGSESRPRPLIRRQAVVRASYFSHELLPSELVRVVLRQRRGGVAVLGYRRRE